ncbi:MAG: PucR family transcriptional regulator [bacterium]
MDAELNEPGTAEALDLFGLCNHLAWEIGGPTLIHDVNWRVLAYSTLRQEIDEGRLQAILQREVPHEHGFLGYPEASEARFAAGEDVFELPAYPGIQARRVVAAIRVHGVVVGSLWSAESSGMLHPDAFDIARTGAKQAAALLQVDSDFQSLEDEAVAALILQEGHDERFLARYLGVSPRSRCRVLAVGTDVAHERISAAAMATTQHGQALLLSQSSPDRLHLVVVSRDAERPLGPLVKALLNAIGAIDPCAVVGIGDGVSRLCDVHRSRYQADDILEHLLQGAPQRRFATWSDVRYGVSLERIVRAAPWVSSGIYWPLQALQGLESEDRTEALGVLHAYVDTNSNAAEAARRLGLHPNTFRYRLSRALELIGVDLEDREARLMLELDLLRHRLDT